MSDYFTNLVIRSFSPVASVQPMGASLSVAPELFEGSSRELSDPFAEAASSGDDDSKAESATPERKPSRDKPARLEELISEAPIRSDQASSAVPFVNRQGNTITPLQPALPDPAESAALRVQSNPPLADESRAKPKEQPRKPASLEPSIASASLPSSEKPFEPAAPIRKASGTGKPLVNPSLGPLQMERVKELPSVPPGIASFVAGRTNDSAYILYDEPIEIGVSTWHLIKKPGKAGSLSPQTSLPHLTRSDSAAADNLQPSAVVGNVVGPTTAALEKRQETRASLNTLIPKVNSQPLLPATVKTRSNFESRQAPFETAAQLPLTETIINVAIGRIEVRATPSEGPKRERQSKGPKVMNLDDYMQQRSRGNG